MHCCKSPEDNLQSIMLQKPGCTKSVLNSGETVRGHMSYWAHEAGNVQGDL